VCAVWDAHRAHGLVLDAMRRESARRSREQSHLGIDALGELSLHPIIRDALEAEWTVLHEQRYPGGSGKSRRSEGERCDVVLIDARAGSAHLADPLMSGTLFAGRGVEPERAVWLEVKSVGQFAMFEDGFARPNPRYSSLLLREIPRDVRKLGSDPRIRCAGVAVMHFCAEAAIAENDLRAMADRLRERAGGVSAPIVGSFDIPDHIGNALCTLALIPVHHSP